MKTSNVNGFFQKPLAQWFAEYGVSHQNPVNQLIHKICVPLIFLSVAGLVFRTPEAVAGLIIGLVMTWYALSFGRWVFFVMASQVLIAWALDILLIAPTGRPIEIYLGIFVLAWIGQFIGHKIEGKKPSFFQDLQFLLIGPLWVLRSLLRQ